MTSRSGRSAAPAILMAAALALSACSAGNLSTTPTAQKFDRAPSAGFHYGEWLRVATLDAQPNARCPKQYLYCYTVSKKSGGELVWCYGAASNPCTRSNAASASWSGVVCKATRKICKKPIEELTATWSGPFKCKKRDGCRGTYELDSLTPGSGLRISNTYLYKQHIHVCKGANCQDAYIGLNVGK